MQANEKTKNELHSHLPWTARARIDSTSLAGNRAQDTAIPACFDSAMRPGRFRRSR